MNRFVWICLGAVLLSACLDSGKKETVSETIVPVDVDSVETLADTLATDSQEVVPPHSVDELFDDFIYSFSTNRRFQYRRIDFPLRVSENGDTTYLSKKEWQFNSLHAEEDVYVLLLNNERQLHLLADSLLANVSLEWIYLQKSQVKQYLFHKGRGEWRLSEVRFMPLTQYAGSSFMNFYRKFATDSLFQREHVADYVDFVTFDDDISHQKINGVVDIDQWFAFRPQLPTDVLVHMDCGQRFPDRNKRVLVFRGISNSMMNVLTFQRYEHSWRLVKFEI